MVTQDDIRGMVMLWQTRLNLLDWDVAVSFGNSIKVNGHECHMKVHRSGLYKRASMAVGAGALDPSKLPDSIEGDLLKTCTIDHEEFVEASVVHELLHMLLRDLIVVTEMIEDHLSSSIQEMLHEAQTRAEEATVEHLALALVRNWPEEDA